MSGVSVCRAHAHLLLTRQTWIKLLPYVGLTGLSRHSSLLAQLIAAHSDCDNVSSSRSMGISLKPAASHTHRPLPSHRSRKYCTDLSCHTPTQTSRTLREFRSQFRSLLQSPFLASRLYSTSPSLFYCHKSPTELQKSQRIDRSDEEEERDKSSNASQQQRPTQLFQLIRTVLREEGEALQVDERDPEHNIQRNIRPAVAGDPEVVTERLKELLRGVHHGNRAKLAEAITLIESKHNYKHKQAQWLLTKILSHQSKLKQLEKLRPTIRLGFSGPPGAGKSTLIESFGTMLTSMDYRVAVLAVDPSSSRTGGSILGDKTRMAKLSRDPKAYIRPTPSGGSLGGVARNTNEAIILCEAAGYDIILVETVGVGQSEIAVCDMVDMFVLIIPPAAGDELQGIKRGIVELADLVIVNKADGDLLPAARRIKAEYVSALKLLRTKHRAWNPKVLKVSALENNGMEDIWKAIVDFDTKMKRSGEFKEKRKQQQKSWMWAHIELELRDRFKRHPTMAYHIVDMEKRVMAGSMAPGTAADILLDKFLQSSRSN